MKAEELRRLTRKYIAVLDGIGDLMDQHKVSGVDGETLLLYLAGLSAGNRQAPICGQDWMIPAGIGWGFGAEHGEG